MPTPYEVGEYGLARPIEATNVFVAKVYSWMGIGLGVTAAVALLVSSSPAAMQLIYGTPYLPLGLLVTHSTTRGHATKANALART